MTAGAARPTRFVVVQTGLCAVLTMLTGLLYGTFFADPAYAIPVLAAAVVGAVGTVGVLLLLRRPRGILALVLVLLACAGAVVATRGLLQGWARMLTVSLPADAVPATLAAPVLTTGLAAVGSVAVALRTSAPASPVGPPAGAFVLGLLAVASQPGDHLLLAAAFLLVALMLCLLRANMQGGAFHPCHPGDQTTGAGSGWPWATIAGGLPLVGVAVLIGVIGANWLPLADPGYRFNPQAHYPPELALREVITPLATMNSQLEDKTARNLFAVRVDDKPALDRIRVVALDQYDGLTWSCGVRFLRAGHILAAKDARTGTRHITARVTVQDLAGPFLPTFGAPVGLDRRLVADQRVGYDSVAGLLVVDMARLAGTEYSVTAEIHDPDDGLAQASPSRGARYSASLPNGLPPALLALATRLARQAPGPYGRLRAIERYLATVPYDADAPPGHSYGILARMLPRTDAAPSAGNIEQHAAAFAVLARAIGMPTRVVVGYRLRRAVAGHYQITTLDAYAWPEVHFDGYGWVTFDPIDLRRVGKAPAVSGSVSPLPSPVPTSMRPPPITMAPTSAPPPTPGPGQVRAPGVGSGSRTGVWLAALIAGMLAGCLVVVPLVVVAAKARRRRVRRRGAPADRVVGAWQEVVDRLAERGVRPTCAMTPLELAAHAGSALGAAATGVGALAPLAAAAVFRPEPPDERTVTSAWALVGRVTIDLHGGRRSLRRLRAWLDPRPLVRAGPPTPQPHSTD